MSYPIPIVPKRKRAGSFVHLAKQHPEHITPHKLDLASSLLSSTGSSFFTSSALFSGTNHICIGRCTVNAR